MLLRPYQSEAIEAARAKFRANAKRTLLVLPTGGGKTVIASEIIRSAEARGSRVVFLAHRRELIAQTSDKLHRFGVRHGTIMAGERPAPQLAVQVASIQTLVRRLDAYPSFDLIFFDEAHHAAAGGYQKVLELYPRARVVGLTATPWRLDGRGLADVFDSHVIVRTPKQLRDEGYLCAVGGWEFEAIDTTKARVQGGDFKAKDLEESASSKRVIGDVVEEWLRYSPGKRTVVFAVSIATSQLLTEAFVKAGVRAEHIDGEMETAQRDAIVAQPGLVPAGEVGSEPYSYYSTPDGRVSYLITRKGSPAHPAIMIQRAQATITTTGCAYGSRKGYDQLLAYLESLKTWRRQ